MEFSFDRSNETQLRKSTTSTDDAQSAPADDGIDTSTIANERLRKAIERNRARQAERNRNQPQPSFAQAQTKQQPQQEQSTLFDRPQADNADEEPAKPRRERPRAQERTQSSLPRAQAVVTRRTVARADEADFTPTKRAPRKVASQISYSTTNSRKKSKPLDPTFVGYLVKGCWIFCAIMVLRLIFANGGVTDYYSNRSVFNDRVGELERIKKENMQIVHEIERMQTDIAFQKKLKNSPSKTQENI